MDLDSQETIASLESAHQHGILSGVGTSAHFSRDGRVNSLHAPYFLLKGKFTFFKGSQYVFHDNKRISINGLDNLLHPSNVHLRNDLDAEALSINNTKHLPELKNASNDNIHNVLIECSWAANYYHFSLDVLGKVMVASKFLPLANCRFLLNSWKPFQRDYLSLSGYEYHWIGYDSFYKGDIYIPSLPGASGAPPLETLQFIRNLPIETDNSFKDEYVYISRNDASRKVLNEEELLDSLCNILPFRRVCLSEYSVHQQINLFRNAKLIAGTHGAGMTNLIHMTSPKGVFEIFGDAYQAPMFKNICKELSIPYASVNASDQMILAGQQPGWNSDILIDITMASQSLESFVAQLGAN